MTRKAAKTKKPGPKGRKRKAAKKRTAGRPEYEPKPSDRQTVMTLIGGGQSLEEVAAALDLSEKTVTKHFARELLIGRSKRRAEILEAMFNSAKGGNVSAQKAYLQLNALADVDHRVQNPGKDEPAPAPSKATKIYKGKKEIAQEEAASVGGPGSEWGSDLDPSAPPPGAKAH